MATIIDMVDYIIVLKQELQNKDNIIKSLQQQLETYKNNKNDK